MVWMCDSCVAGVAFLKGMRISEFFEEVVGALCGVGISGVGDLICGWRMGLWIVEREDSLEEV